MTRPLRPDFLIVGAPKAGTTAPHSALAQHPDWLSTADRGSFVERRSTA